MTGFNNTLSFIMFIVCMAGQNVSGQQAMINVVDSKTGEPVPYAHVCFESVNSGEQIHKLTDDDGKAINPVAEKSIVAISFVGYETLIDTVLPGQRTTFHFEPAIFNMNEVVVTAQYTPQRVDKSIYKVKVLGAKEINRKAANDLAELFADELNMRISHDGALGSSMSIRGLSGEHVKFLIDGVPVIGRMNGNVDLGQLNLNNVDHVEVIEGPMSVVYGSNALAGVVNIITKENKNIPVTAGADAYVESVGTYNFSAAASVKRKMHIFGISGSRNFFGGFGENDSLRSMTWKPKRQYIIDGYYIYDHKKFKLKYSPRFFNELIWNKGNVIEPHYARDSYFRTNRLNNSFDFSTRVGDERFLKVLAAYSTYERVKSTYFKNLHTLDEKPTTNDSDQDTTRFNAITLRSEFSKSTDESILNYQFGLDANIEIGSGRKIEGNQQQIGDYAAFLSLKIKPLSSLTIQPGIRLIYNTKYSAPMVYSINARWDIMEHSVIRASYSRGFRAPSLKELYLYFVDINHNIQGNENLEAEDSHNLLMTLGYNNDKGKANWGMDVDLFYNTINNIITIAQVRGDLYSYINIDNYTSQGVQAELFYDHYPRFKWNIGVAHTGRKNVIEGESAELKDFLYSSDLSSSAAYRFRKINSEISVFYKYTGRLPQYYQSGEGQLREGYIEDYHTMDVTVKKSLFKNQLQVSAGIKNLFDVKSIYSSGGGSFGSVHGSGGGSLIGYGRTVFAGISYSFNKF